MDNIPGNTVSAVGQKTGIERWYANSPQQGASLSNLYRGKTFLAGRGFSERSGGVGKKKKGKTNGRERERQSRHKQREMMESRGRV